MNNGIVNCTNKALVAFFLKNGIKPIDMFIGRNDTIIFQYNATESQKCYEEWLNQKNNQ